MADFLEELMSLCTEKMEKGGWRDEDMRTEGYEWAEQEMKDKKED